VDLATGKEKSNRRQAGTKRKRKSSEPDFPAHNIHESRVKGRKKESWGAGKTGERNLKENFTINF
jgi:hypothetical protein